MESVGRSRTDKINVDLIVETDNYRIFHELYVIIRISIEVNTMYDDIRHPGAVDTKSVLLMDGPFAYALAEIFGIVDTAGNPVDQLEATLDS